MATGRRNGAVSCATNVAHTGRAGCVLRARIRANIYVIAKENLHTAKQLTKPEPKTDHRAAPWRGKRSGR